MIDNQRGGIVSFGIVTLVLLGLLAGGLYMSKNQARVARDTDTSTPQVSAPQKDTNKEKKPAQIGTKPTETKPAETPAKKPVAQTPTPTPAVTTPAPSAAPTTARVASTGPSTPLPATGPADVAFVTIGLGILGFTSYQLYNSRRRLQRAALDK